MSGFKRSPSKVWWGNESVEWREVSASPGSQDSGFSDTETSPQLQNAKDKEAKNISKEIYEKLSISNNMQNITGNYVEKCTPKKSIQTQLNCAKSDGKYSNSTKIEEQIITRTAPVKKHRFMKNSPKVSRNLFNASKQMQRNTPDNQYSKDVNQEITHSKSCSEETVDNDQSNNCYEIYTTQTLPTEFPSSKSGSFSDSKANKSAPAILQNENEDEAITSFNGSLSSDCESELECLFSDQLDSPKHTSTPKTVMRSRKEKFPLHHHLFLKNQQSIIRVPQIHTPYGEVDNKSVEKWMQEARQTYEQECMTTLQSKSIAGELNQKVSQLAASFTTNIREILSHTRAIQVEFQNVNSEKKHVGPLVQSLTGNIYTFIKSHLKKISNRKIIGVLEKIRSSTPEEALQIIAQLYYEWEAIEADIITIEAHKLVEKLENPASEIVLRATVTAITSISLHNTDLIDFFTKLDIIPILLILCEKCEGSSLRSLLLRALSTICSNTLAVRQLEKFSGLQIISDTIADDSRPEPERAEAIALLAQITAPWLEDNHCVNGLQDHSRSLVKALTKFVSSTKCCQNLLLSTAALANLSSMDTKCIKFMLHFNSVPAVLDAVRGRGLRASVYILEQVATLIANISSVEAARLQLTAAKAPAALLRFLHMSNISDDLAKRVQQKSIIALSRLCSDKEAAMQVVELGGVEKLVKMCREKDERFDNDAVLVATLATLRKITDVCGSNVMDSQDVQELVEPKLLDSFLAYSSQNESYV